jgi:hypothetical protein
MLDASRIIRELEHISYRTTSTTTKTLTILDFFFLLELLGRGCCRILHFRDIHSSLDGFRGGFAYALRFLGSSFTGHVSNE